PFWGEENFVKLLGRVCLPVFFFPVLISLPILAIIYINNKRIFKKYKFTFLKEGNFMLEEKLTKENRLASDIWLRARQKT
ncbi:MAG TPA: hypothetical protein PLC88_04275, partial [Syntrophomonas sp.]|nr:hypothetical protein [Syntrophomonas sp.]